MNDQSDKDPHGAKSHSEPKLQRLSESIFHRGTDYRGDLEAYGVFDAEDQGQQAEKYQIVLQLFEHSSKEENFVSFSGSQKAFLELGTYLVTKLRDSSIEP